MSLYTCSSILFKTFLKIELLCLRVCTLTIFTTRPRLECLRETGLILRCDRKVGNPFHTKQGSRPSRPDQEGRKGSEEGVPENLSVPLEGDRESKAYRSACEKRADFGNLKLHCSEIKRSHYYLPFLLTDHLCLE